MSDYHGKISRQDRIVRQWFEYWERNRLQIVGIAVLGCLVFVAWGGSVFYRHYTEGKAASLYASLPESGELRRQSLEVIAREYPTTGIGAFAAFQLGREDYAAQKFDQALAWYEPLMGLEGRQAMIGSMSRNNAAMIYESQGEWARALDIYRQSAADEDNSAKAYAYYNMGRVSQNMGDSEQARQWFEQAIEYGTGQQIAERARDRLIWLNIGSR